MISGSIKVKIIGRKLSIEVPAYKQRGKNKEEEALYVGTVLAVANLINNMKGGLEDETDSSQLRLRDSDGSQLRLRDSPDDGGTLG